jgi:hypothetical protein
VSARRYVLHARWNAGLELVSRDGAFYMRSARTKRCDRLPLTDIDAAQLALTADEVLSDQPGGEWFDALLAVAA